MTNIDDVDFSEKIKVFNETEWWPGAKTEEGQIREMVADLSFAVGNEAAIDNLCELFAQELAEYCFGIDDYLAMEVLFSAFEEDLARKICFYKKYIEKCLETWGYE